MNDALTARQAQILKAIIDEYIEAAEAVGSEVLEKKYNLGVSSATVRNEMVTLTKMGYLKQLHTSAGRVPTPKAMKFYVNQLMEEKQMSLVDEVKAKEEVWDHRADIGNLMDEATQSLASRTRNLSFAIMDDGRSWHAGLANIFADPEFTDLNTCANVFSFIEESSRMIDMIMRRFDKISSNMDVIFGEELRWPGFEPVGMVTTRLKVRGKNGALGIIGPVRLQFPTVIPVVRYFGHMVEEVANA